MNRVVAGAGAILALSGLSVGAWFVHRLAVAAAKEEAQGDRAIGHAGAAVVVAGEHCWKLKDPAAAGVRAEPAKGTTASREEIAPGEVVVAPGRSWEVRAPFAGTVGRGARELALGASVDPGERLATLAPQVSPDARFDVQLRRRTAESDRESARADLELAKKELARAEDLAKDASIAPKALDEARSKEARAQSTFDEAERRASALRAVENRASFDELEFLAPVAGVLARLEAAPGARVQAGDLLFTVESREDLRVRVDIVPGLDARAHPPEHATLSFPALGNAEREGELVAVDPHVRPGTLSVAAFYALEKTEGLALRPGEPALARLATGQAGPAVVVPASALLVRDGQTWVYVLAGEGAFARRSVTVLGHRGDDVVLGGKVAPGEPVVVAGAAVLLAEELKPLIVVESEGGPADDDQPKKDDQPKEDEAKKDGADAKKVTK